jgi:uncharacterized protein
MRWAVFTTRRRGWILGVCLLGTAAAAVIAAGLPVEGDLMHLLPSDTPSVRDLRQLEQRAQVFGTIIAAVEVDGPAHTAERAAAAELVRRRLAALGPEQVAGINLDEGPMRRFIWENRLLYAPVGDIEAVRDALTREKARANPLFVNLDDEPERGADKQAIGARLRRIEAMLDEARKLAENPGTLASKDGTLQMVVVRTRFRGGDVAANAPALAAARRAAAEAEQQAPGVVRVRLTGDVVNNAAEQQALIGGMLRATVFTVAIVAAGMLLFFRSLGGLASLFAALAVGGVASFAIARVTVGQLNLATAFLAPIVVGNGINFGVILLARYLEEKQKRPHRAPEGGSGGGGSDDGGEGEVRATLAAAVSGAFPGTLGAALTASVSYGALLTTGFRGFRHFGAIGAIGILLCWGATFLVLPALLAVFECRGRGVRGRIPQRPGRWIAGLVPRRRAATLVLAAVTAVLAFAGAWRYVSADPYEKDFKKLRSNGPAIQEARSTTRTIDGAFGRGISGGTVLALPSLERARQVAARLRANDGARPERQRLFARVSSLDDLLPPDQDVKLALLADIRRLLTESTLAALPVADRDLARALRPPADLRPVTLNDVPIELAWPYTERDGTRGRLLIATVGPGFDLWLTDGLDRFVRGFRELRLGDDVVVGGSAFVQHDIVRSLTRDSPRATLAAAVGALLVVLLVLGFSRHAGVTLICGALGVLLLLGAAHVLGIRVNFLDFVALPITIGIGIDYAVNIAARSRAEGPGSARRVVTAVGPAVALCSYTTVVGYASLILSPNQGIHSFGRAALVGELTCLVSALALAPALLDLTQALPDRTTPDTGASRPVPH